MTEVLQFELTPPMTLMFINDSGVIMGFLEEAAASEGGEIQRGYKPRFADPIEGARVRFVESIAEQIVDLQAGKKNDKGEIKGAMYAQIAGGLYKVILRNGTTAMKIGGKEYFIKKTVDEAVQFLAKAADAARNGELDKIFADTNRVPKSKKKSAVNVIDSVKNGATTHA